MKRQHRKRPPVVVITGASAGVGRATVREFAKHGARIGLIARSRDGLEGARREVIEAGGRALAIPADVAFPDQVESAADAVERMLGPIDVWVNNAMVSVLSPAIEVTPEEFKRVTDVTYLGYVYGTLAALKRMKPRDHGVIVQVGSALAYRSPGDWNIATDGCLVPQKTFCPACLRTSAWNCTHFMLINHPYCRELEIFISAAVGSVFC